MLGPLVSRDHLQRGELKQLIRELAERDYAIPGSDRGRIGEKTIEAWYYAWRRGGIEALTPMPRSDRGRSKLPAAVQAALLDAMLTPETVHYGRAEAVLEKRQLALNNAFKLNPKRFKGKMPVAAPLPEAAWINQPTATNDNDAEKAA